MQKLSMVVLQKKKQAKQYPETLPTSSPQKYQLFHITEVKNESEEGGKSTRKGGVTSSSFQSNIAENPRQNL